MMMMHTLPESVSCFVPLLGAHCHSWSKKTAGAKQRELYNTKKRYYSAVSHFYRAPSSNWLFSTFYGHEHDHTDNKRLSPNPQTAKKLIAPSCVSLISHKEREMPALNTDAKEEGVPWVNHLYGSDWSPQSKAWNKKGFHLPEIVLINLIVRKLRIRKIKGLLFWGHTEGKMHQFESHVLSHLEYSIVSEKPIIYNHDKSHNKKIRTTQRF